MEDPGSHHATSQILICAQAGRRKKQRETAVLEEQEAGRKAHAPACTSVLEEEPPSHPSSNSPHISPTQWRPEGGIEVIIVIIILRGMSIWRLESGRRAAE